MVPYMGNKSRYASTIVNYLRKLEQNTDRPIWDICCGSGEVSAFWGKPTVMVDSGPWGRFWFSMFKLKPWEVDVVKYAASRVALTDDQFEDFCRRSLTRQVPNTFLEYATVFLALQKVAYNGKPVEIKQNSWFHPGFIDRFSLEAYQKSWERACRVRMANALCIDANKITVPDGTLVYIDPDYLNTTGYGDRTFNVSQFVNRHPRVTFLVSHDSVYPGVEWDSVVDISQDSGRTERGSSVSDREVLLLRKARYEAPSIENGGTPLSELG